MNAIDLVDTLLEARKPKVVPPTEPYARAAFDAGGTLLRVPLNRVRFQQDLERYAPGCGAPTHVMGTNGGMLPCGALLTVNGVTKPHFCPACEQRQSKEGV